LPAKIKLSVFNFKLSIKTAPQELQIFTFESGFGDYLIMQLT
jgi:hypothetical protein